MSKKYCFQKKSDFFIKKVFCFQKFLIFAVEEKKFTFVFFKVNLGAREIFFYLLFKFYNGPLF